MIWNFTKSVVFLSLTALGFNNLAERIGISYIQSAINNPDDSSEGSSNGMNCGRAIRNFNLSNNQKVASNYESKDVQHQNQSNGKKT